MNRPKRNVLLAMFDVRPKNKFGRVDFEKMSSISSKLDLASHSVENEDTLDDELTLDYNIDYADTIPVEKVDTSVGHKKNSQVTTLTNRLVEGHNVATPKDLVLRELEQNLQNNVDLDEELSNIGGKVYSSLVNVRPRQQFVQRTHKKANSYKSASEFAPVMINVANHNEPKENFIPQIGTVTYGRSPAAQEIDAWLISYKNNQQEEASTPQTVKKSKPEGHIGRKIIATFATLSLILFFVLLFQRGEIVVRRSLEQSGNSAISNLNQAKVDLQRLDFNAAAESFALAYDDFNRASGTLDKMGASFISVFSKIPGLAKVQTASDLIKAGQFLSEAGENLSLAAGTISNTNFLAFLHPASPVSEKPISSIVRDFKEVLEFADRNVQRSERILKDIDSSLIPEDKRILLDDFKTKIPEFKEYIGGAIEYSDFLLSFIGEKGTKKYLLLFQNNTELRPTGGFPGTYGLITFDHGYLKKVFVDDIYNIDGQIKKNIIPPVPLQHITPNWGMRDSAWFADFAMSAQKVEEFYKYDGGSSVDGVIAITPYIIDRILGVIGPIEMPEYNISLSRDNFLTIIQDEVEYKANRAFPKQIVVDFQPKFFEKLSQQNKATWIEIGKILLESIEEKHILAYFNDEDLQIIASRNGLSGALRESSDDYLQVVFSNIKGAKTDAVTENTMRLDTLVDGSKMTHTLSIERVHNGGGSEYDFYNKQNSSYVQVFVPQGSVLTGISGNSFVNYKPLVDYNKLGFKKDELLASIEEATTRTAEGVDIYDMSGKTVFGLWLNTDPKKRSQAILKYEIPKHNLNNNLYELVWQKQAGTINDRIQFGFKIPNGKNIINMSPGAQGIGNTVIFNSDLTVDREVKLQFN